MIKLNFTGELNGLKEGLNYLSEELGVSLSSEGISISLEQRPESDKLKISFDGEQGRIVYSSPSTFFRQLNLWLVNYRNDQTFEKEETVYFNKTGAMIDASRNAVLSVEGTKEFLRQMAKLGLNLAMLYTEDTFEVKDYPYFGYLRGRYSAKELKELDEYAHNLGIEMIPCIQTLGHLYQVLQYGNLRDIQDTSDVLLVGEPKTYEFITRIIKAATDPFRSNRIHIGMDEAFGVGTGKYKQLNGERDIFEVMNEHVQKVIGITENLGLEAMMWSDMYLRIGSETHDYYDPKSVIPEHIIDNMPDVNMVYWDYYHEDEEIYRNLLQRHIDMKQKVIFAGGVWTWNGIAPNYGKSIETTKSALKMCKEANAKEVFATMWGDDGGETPVFSALPALQVFADLSYREDVDVELANDVCEQLTGLTYDEFYLLNSLDETPGVKENNLETAAPSKVLLWQDPLLGRFDKGIEGLELNTYYYELSKKLGPLTDKGQYKEIMSFYHQLAVVLSDRAEFGLNLKNAYDAKDKDQLNSLLKTAEELISELDRLRLAHRKVWMKYNKAFGWEIIEIRYGGTIARMSTVVDRLSAYLNGELSTLEELEEDRLIDPIQEHNPGRGIFTNISSTSKLSGV